LYYKGGAADLRLVDPNFDSVQPDDKVALAMSVCEEIMGKDDRIISANASYSDEKDFKYMVASNGFEGEACAQFPNGTDLNGIFAENIVSLINKLLS